MDATQLRMLLEAVGSGQTSVERAFEQLRDLPFADLGFAQVDHHRVLRQGLPEVILGEPKTAEQIAAIAQELLGHGQNVLITRLDSTKAQALRSALPSMNYAPLARTGTIEVRPIASRAGAVAIVTAGTGDMPVAEEAAETLRMAGVQPSRVYDVGVAGIHRLLAYRERLEKADVVIVVAGMEGALPSVVGGLVSCPVVAVPTSVGYGAHLAGLTPLMAMLSSCASGLVVVNIDNGFGAAMAAHRVLMRLG